MTEPDDPVSGSDRQPEPAAPERIALLWGHDQHDAVAVKGHGNTRADLLAACISEGYSDFAVASTVWVCRVPDRTGDFSQKWIEVDQGNRRARAWTILEGLTRAPAEREAAATDTAWVEIHGAVLHCPCGVETDMTDSVAQRFCSRAEYTCECGRRWFLPASAECSLLDGEATPMSAATEPRATTKQLAMMRHATGDKVQGHRNYYCVPVGPSETRDAWDDLVASGLAGAGEPPDADDPGGNREKVYHVTPAGFRMAYGAERRPERVGDPGVRDPDHPCEEFEPGEPVGRCQTDGHYMCRECVHAKLCETCDQIDAQCECPPDADQAEAYGDLVTIRLPGWVAP